MMKLVERNPRPALPVGEILEHPHVRDVGFGGTEPHQVVGDEVLVGNDDDATGAERKADGGPLAPATVVEMAEAHRVARRRPAPPHRSDRVISAEDALEWIARGALLRDVGSGEPLGTRRHIQRIAKRAVRADHQQTPAAANMLEQGVRFFRAGPDADQRLNGRRERCRR